MVPAHLLQKDVRPFLIFAPIPVFYKKQSKICKDRSGLSSLIKRYSPGIGLPAGGGSSSLRKKCSFLPHLTVWRLLTGIDTMPRVRMHQVGSQTEGIGILTSDIRKEITSEVTIHWIVPSVRFTNHASVQQSAKSGCMPSIDWLLFPSGNSIKIVKGEQEYANRKFSRYQTH